MNDSRCECCGRYVNEDDLKRTDDDVLVCLRCYEDISRAVEAVAGANPSE